jgi:UDP-N-acetylmuramoyl-L-alanyl-D-glutamate--2,6-diaminopimelate ligase
MQIVNDIMSGFLSDKSVKIILDRQQAVEFALSHLGSEDCVLIAGKGHETVQWVGEQAKPLSDIMMVENYLEKIVPKN